MSRYVTKYVGCDMCGDELGFLESESVEDGMLEQGWVCDLTSGRDYCPKCREKAVTDGMPEPTNS
jgi:hypothetical protein